MVSCGSISDRLTTAAIADEVKPAAGLRPGHFPACPPTQSLFSVVDQAGGTARFIWSAGRLQLDAPRHKIGNRSLNTPDTQQRLSISAVAGVPSLHYTLSTPLEQLRLDVRAATELTIVHRQRSTTVDAADAVDSVSSTGDGQCVCQTTIYQPPRGPIKTTVCSGDRTRIFWDATWLHLYLNHRAEVPHSVWELVDRLPPQPLNRLVTSVDETLHRSLRTTPHWKQPDRDLILSESNFHDLLSELRDPSRARRAAAHRSLLAAGTAVAIHIENYSGDLDAHQSQVLTSVWRAVHPPLEDHVGSLASRLYGDRDYWLGWQKRQIGPLPAGVAAHLKRLRIDVQEPRALAIAE